MSDVLRCGLIGAHIGRSRLSAALEILCAEHGMTLDFTAIDSAGVEAFDFERTVQGCIARGWTGVTVTHPWKPAARALAGDEMEASVSGLTASNTLVFGVPFKGYNTDFTGFLDAWAARMDRAPGRVAMAGAGGVAGALAPALVRLGAEVQVWDVEPARAETLAAECGTGVRAIAIGDSRDAMAGADGLVNATALGMGDDVGSAFPPEAVGGQIWAFDAVYTPVVTPFLRTAQAAGLTILTGFDLFRHMALRSFAAYTGIRPDPVHCLPMLERLKPE